MVVLIDGGGSDGGKGWGHMNRLWLLCKMLLGLL